MFAKNTVFLPPDTRETVKIEYERKKNVYKYMYTNFTINHMQLKGQVKKQAIYGQQV